jgi:scyllo-inositol 2-dehydrogenase (NADP+)
MAGTGSGPITAAVIGLGRAGYGIHVAAMRNRQDYKITAVVDPLEERRAAVAQELNCRGFATLEECLAGDQAELVVVATVSKDHAPHSITALKAGRNVLTEKPMATTVADADKMILAQRQSGKVLTVHHQRRLDQSFQYVRDLIHDERLGDVFHIRRYSGGFARRNDWQTLRKYGGGSLNNNGVHMLDSLYLLLESPVRDVWGDLRNINSAGDADDHCKIVIRGYNERVIDAELTSACALSQPEWVILGTRGTAVIERKTPKEPTTATIKWYAKDALGPLEVVDATAAAGRKYGVGEKIPWNEAVEVVPGGDGEDFYTLLYATLRQGAPLTVDPMECRAVLDIMGRARVGTRFMD